jgi:membrane protease subunit HflK
LSRVPTLALALAAVALAAWLATGLCVVEPGEVIVVRRLGRPLTPPWGAGLHLGWPAPLDHRDRVRIDEVRRLDIGPLADAAEADSGTGEYLTGDRNLLHARASIQFRIADPAAYLHAAMVPERALARLGESALARALTASNADALLREGRAPAAADALDRLRADIARLGLGIEVLSVQLSDLRPPTEVAPDFDAAQSAASDRERRVREGQAEADLLAAETRASAGSIVDAARSDAATRLAAAQARADRFRAVLASNRREPALTRRRLYLETLETIFRSARRKLVLPADAPIDLGIAAPQ